MPPVNRCSGDVVRDRSRRERKRGTHLDGVQYTQLTAMRVAEVVLPQVEGLERVHERTIITVCGGGDQTEEDRSAFMYDTDVTKTYSRTIQAWRTIRRLLLYHVLL